MLDILGLPVSPAGNGDGAVLSPCPGKTVWDWTVEQWEDQATVRLLMGVMHERELARVAKPPPLQVRITDLTSPISELTVDQDAHTLAFTVRNPEPDTTLVAEPVIAEPVYPAPDLRFEDDTATETLTALTGETAVLPAIEAAPEEKAEPVVEKPVRRRKRAARREEPGG